MAYVIYSNKTFHLHETKNGSYFSSERIAKGVRTRAKLDPSVWTVATSDDFSKAEPMVTVKNLLSGKDVQIRASERGGCCDPSTERYHCM